MKTNIKENMANIMIKPYRGNDNTDGTSYPEKSFAELVNWGTHVGSIGHGHVMLRGWVYDMTPYLKRYLVKSVYEPHIWRETLALNKAHARELVGDNTKCKVIELNKE